jgi:hypothetical protein
MTRLSAIDNVEGDKHGDSKAKEKNEHRRHEFKEGQQEGGTVLRDHCFSSLSARCGSKAIHR